MHVLRGGNFAGSQTVNNTELAAPAALGLDFTASKQFLLLPNFYLWGALASHTKFLLGLS
jgi:hypothetical protein